MNIAARAEAIAALDTDEFGSAVARDAAVGCSLSQCERGQVCGSGRDAGAPVVSYRSANRVRRAVVAITLRTAVPDW